ncbi:MAG TPA: YtxH domain-containing protein [Bacteroidales bacterium]|nr:YtxH domain-containing protein [Bacteroidales bacterium]
MKPAGSFITGLLAGAAIGGIIALLYAPKSGKETRQDLKRKLEDLEKEFETLKDKASHKTDNIKKDIADRLADLQREIEHLSGSI